jgi:acyl-homoserine-lactone acylase
MKDAIAYFKDKEIPLDAPWGSVHVAGDEGAPLLPLGGGDAGPGNANVTTSRDPASHPDAYSAVSYGSSHIQAVAFMGGGKVNAHTILTYSQSTDPTSPFSADQTKLFSNEKWARFAFTPAQVRADRIGAPQVVSGG